LAEVYKQYFLLIQAVVQSPALAALQHPDIQPLISTLMNQLHDAIRTPVESELSRQAVAALNRLASAWCDPDSSFEAFIFDSILPTALDELTSGAVDVRNDAKAVLLIGELCNLLRTTAVRLGDRGVFRVYSLLTSTLSCVSHTEANDFCTAVRDSGSARPMQLRQALRQLLEIISSRRGTSSS
jgi:hypothetical protein